MTMPHPAPYLSLFSPPYPHQDPPQHPPPCPRQDPAQDPSPRGGRGRRRPRRRAAPWTRAVLMVWALLATACATLPEPLPLAAESALPAAADSPLARIAAASLPTQPPGASGFRLFFSGEAAFNARIALVRLATRSIDLQVYHFAADETGRGLLRELRDAAERGVRVRLLVDDLHAGGQDALFAGLAAHANAQVRLFNPLAPRQGTPVERLVGSLNRFDQVNRRMHNKLMLADTSFAVFGGRNVGDAYFMNDPQANFLDLDVLAAGPVVVQLAAVFDAFWNSPHAYPVQRLAAPASSSDVARRDFDAAVNDGTVRLGERQSEPYGRQGILRQLASGRLALDAGTAQVWADAPEKVGAGEAGVPTVAARVFEWLGGAREQALVMSPYFIPGPDGLDVLRRLIERNVPVTLLTNSFGATDEPLAYVGYERYRRELLRAGVQIRELSPTLVRDSGVVAYFGESIGRLHAKALAVDGRWLFVGSTNLDPRSAFSNTELGVVIDSPPLVKQFAALFRNIANGAFTLRLVGDGRRIEWVATDWHGRETAHTDEPHDDRWLRFKLWLLQPIVPEQLL